MARARCWADKRSKSKTKTDFENASQWQVVIKYFMIFVNVQLKRMHKFVCHKKCFDFWADTLSTTKRHISCFFLHFEIAWMLECFVYRHILENTNLWLSCVLVVLAAVNINLCNTIMESWLISAIKWNYYCSKQLSDKRIFTVLQYYKIFIIYWLFSILFFFFLFFIFPQILYAKFQTHYAAFLIHL